MRSTVIAAALVALAVTAACSSTVGGTAHNAPSPSTSGPPAIVASNPFASMTPTPVYSSPSPSDFTITVKVLSKQCFGDAGCDLTYRAELAMNLPAGSLDPSVTYDVTYEVDGGDSGPQIDTLQVTGDQYTQPGTQAISTGSQGQQLTAKVTDVSPG